MTSPLLCVGCGVASNINTNAVLVRLGFLPESAFDIGHPPPLLCAKRVKDPSSWIFRCRLVVELTLLPRRGYSLEKATGRGDGSLLQAGLYRYTIRDADSDPAAGHRQMTPSEGCRPPTPLLKISACYRVILVIRHPSSFMKRGVDSAS